MLSSISLDPDKVLNAARSPGDPSHACAVSLMNLHCKTTFQACEIGTEVRPLCKTACLETLKVCKQSTDFKVAESMCSDEGGAGSAASDSPHCVDLSYEGANHVLWIAGFSIGLAFSFLAALGLNLQKLSMNREAKKPKCKRRPTIRQPLWVIGLSLITSGSLLDFVAFGMAPQSLLAPLGALSLVWNLLIAPLFNKEKLTRQNLVATAIIVFGTLLTVIFASHTTPTYTLEDLTALYYQPVMIVYMVCIVSFLLFMAERLRRIEKFVLKNSNSSVDSEDSEAAGLTLLKENSDEGTDSDSSSQSDDPFPSSPSTPSKSKKRPKLIAPMNIAKLAMRASRGSAANVHDDMSRIICYGGLAGCFGGLSVLLAKSTAELVKNVMTGSESGAFSHFQPYLIVISMAFCLVSQITILNAGLSKFTALLMVPVYQSFWNIFSVLGGIIYFQEYRDLETHAAVLFLAGILTTLGGVFYLLKERVDEIDGKSPLYLELPSLEEGRESLPPSALSNPNEHAAQGYPEWRATRRMSFSSNSDDIELSAVSLSDVVTDT